MICQGVLIDTKLCGRYGSWLAKLARAECRRQGIPIPADLGKLLSELDGVGYRERTRSDADSATSAAPEIGGRVQAVPMSMTTGEAARALGCSEQVIRKRLARGDLHGTKVRGNWILSRPDVEDQARRTFSYRESA